MSEKQQDDGGPAFPTQNGTRNDTGMTLRDHFAGLAMHAIIASGKNGGWRLPNDGPLISRISYEQADAMLAARKGGFHD